MFSHIVDLGLHHVMNAGKETKRNDIRIYDVNTFKTKFKKMLLYTYNKSII